ncbi:MAG: hypothetical protein ACLFQP_10725 [Halothece sp.]
MKKILLGLTTVAAVITVPVSAVLAQYTFPRERSHCTARLTAVNRDSRITLRSGPGTNYRRLGYGLVGDGVYMLTSSPPELDYGKDAQGYVWYRVGFPGSGAKGWIREDFLNRQCRPMYD